MHQAVQTYVHMLQYVCAYVRTCVHTHIHVVVVYVIVLHMYC